MSFGGASSASAQMRGRSDLQNLRLSPARVGFLVSHCFPKGNRLEDNGERPQRINTTSVPIPLKNCCEARHIWRSHIISRFLRLLDEEARPSSARCSDTI